MADKEESLDLNEIMRRNPQIELSRVDEYLRSARQARRTGYSLLHPFAARPQRRTSALTRNPAFSQTLDE